MRAIVDCVRAALGREYREPATDAQRAMPDEDYLCDQIADLRNRLYDAESLRREDAAAARAHMKALVRFALKSGDVLVGIKKGSFLFEGRVYVTRALLEKALTDHARRAATPDESKRDQFLEPENYE